MFPFDGEMLRRLQRAILEEEFLLSVYSNPGWSPALERTFLTQVLQERHRALLAYCTPNEPRNEDLLRDLEAAGVRVIHIEHYRHEPPEQSFVLPDYCRAGMMAATSLLIGGYPRLRFVQLKSEGPYADLLYRGFLDVLQDQRGRPDERDLRVYMKGSMTQEDEARARLDAFIESLEPGTGLLARSTGLARILHRQVLARGLRVPEDVGIVGLELLGESAEANAEVDSIHFDRWALLEEALRLGFAPRADRTQHWCSPTLCRRGSVRGGTDGAAV
jgi:DNA-binding LacI/PurR family transcriptional regulator